jgi:DNA-binding LytR/AlgR family response regulator
MSRNKMFLNGEPGNEVIHFRYNSKMDCVFLKRITYFESDRSYSNIYLSGNKGKPKKICKTLKYIEGYLKDKGFIRCHRFYLININCVRYFCSKSKSIYILGSEIEVSRRASTGVFNILLENGIKDINKAIAG